MILPATDIFADAPRPTPLYSAVASVSDANVWTSVNGWSVPSIITSVEEEYATAKKSAVVADLGPISRYAVRGEDASGFLARITTAPARQLDIGDSARGLILDDRGGVIDLAEVSRLSEDLFLLTTPTAHARRLQVAARGMDAIADEITEQVAVLGVFGPEASEALSAAGLKMPGDIVAASGMVRGVETAARPIQFGALPGIELIFPKEEALTVWGRLLRRGKVTPIGLDALEALRLESGAPRPGLDFVAADRARDGGERTPLELGLAHLAPLDRGGFNGRRGLRRQSLRPKRRLVSLTIDDEVSVPGATVYAGGKSIGRITSCAWSPANKRVIAFADIAADSFQSDYEIAAPAPAEGRVAARLFETAESVLSLDFQRSQSNATEFRL